MLDDTPTVVVKSFHFLRDLRTTLLPLTVIKQGRLDEAIAAGLGCNSCAHLQEELKISPLSTRVDDAGFRNRLADFGASALPEGVFLKHVLRAADSPHADIFIGFEDDQVKAERACKVELLRDPYEHELAYELQFASLRPFFYRENPEGRMVADAIVADGALDIGGWRIDILDKEVPWLRVIA